MNRRYCLCYENHSNKELVPKCNVCGLIVRNLIKPIKDGTYYRRQIQGLLFILEDSNRENFISREYIEEKLKAILVMDNGINFHPGILSHLDALYNPKIEKHLDKDDWRSDDNGEN